MSIEITRLLFSRLKIAHRKSPGLIFSMPAHLCTFSNRRLSVFRLRGILTTVASGNLLSLDVLRRNLDYAISVLESRHLASVE